MLSEKIEKKLNDQLRIESQASYKYLALASWCSVNGFSGAAEFLYEHSDEERFHMMKVLNYINDQGGHAITPAVEQPKLDFKSIREVFEYGYQSEKEVTAAVYEIASLSLEENDHTTHNFIQWYVNEQLEEENLYRGVLDRINLIGEGGNSLYLIDVEVGKLSKGSGGMAAIAEEEA